MFTHTQIARTTKGNNYKGPGSTATIFFPTIQLVICVHNFKILGIVVLEKSLKQNKCYLTVTDRQTDRHTHTHRKDKNYIPPLSILRMPEL